MGLVMFYRCDVIIGVVGQCRDDCMAHVNAFLGQSTPLVLLVSTPSKE